MLWSIFLKNQSCNFDLTKHDYGINTFDLTKNHDYDQLLNTSHWNWQNEIKLEN